MTNIYLKELSNTELAKFLIEKRAEAKSLDELQKDIQDELLNRNDFTVENIEWVNVSMKSRKSISLLPEVNLATIKERYPDLVSVKNILDVKKVDDELMQVIKEKAPDAIKQEYDVNTKLLHECTKDYTTQKVTRYIEVK